MAMTESKPSPTAKNGANPFRQALPLASLAELKTVKTLLETAEIPKGALAEVFGKQLGQLTDEIEKRKALTEAKVEPSQFVIEMLSSLLAWVEGKEHHLSGRAFSLSISGKGVATVSVGTHGSLKVRRRSNELAETLMAVHDDLISSYPLKPVSSGYIAGAAEAIERVAQLAKASKESARFRWESKLPQYFRPEVVNVAFGRYSKEFDSKESGPAIKEKLVCEGVAYLLSLSGAHQ